MPKSIEEIKKILVSTLVKGEQKKDEHYKKDIGRRLLNFLETFQPELTKDILKELLVESAENRFVIFVKNNIDEFSLDDLIAIQKEKIKYDLIDPLPEFTFYYDILQNIFNKRQKELFEQDKNFQFENRIFRIRNQYFFSQQRQNSENNIWHSIADQIQNSSEQTAEGHLNNYHQQQIELIQYICNRYLKDKKYKPVRVAFETEFLNSNPSPKRSKTYIQVNQQDISSNEDKKTFEQKKEAVRKLLERTHNPSVNLKNFYIEGPGAAKAFLGRYENQTNFTDEFLVLTLPDFLRTDFVQMKIFLKSFSNDLIDCLSLNENECKNMRLFIGNEQYTVKKTNSTEEEEVLIEKATDTFQLSETISSGAILLKGELAYLVAVYIDKHFNIKQAQRNRDELLTKRNLSPQTKNKKHKKRKQHFSSERSFSQANTTSEANDMEVETPPQTTTGIGQPKPFLFSSTTTTTSTMDIEKSSKSPNDNAAQISYLDILSKLDEKIQSAEKQKETLENDLKKQKMIRELEKEQKELEQKSEFLAGEIDNTRLEVLALDQAIKEEIASLKLQ